MKRHKIISIFVISIILIFSCSALATAEDMQIKVNGVLLETDVPPVIKDNRTLVPMRAICEELGAAVNYNGEDMSVTVIKGNTTLILYLNSTKAVLNGVETQLDVMPEVINERTMLPLRFLGESLSCIVNWLPESNMVTVESDPIDASSVADELLALINSKRTQIGLNPLIRVQPLNNMAYLQVREMSMTGQFGHISPTRGDLTQRGLQAGLINVSELLSKGGYDAQSIWSEWINNSDYRALLYNENIRFAGIYACYPPGGGADNLYLCLDLLYGDGFFVDSRSGFSETEIMELKGYATDANTRLVVYVLNPDNTDLYLNRYSYYVTPGADNSFSFTLSLAKGGLYAVCIGNDKLTIDMRQTGNSQ